MKRRLLDTEPVILPWWMRYVLPASVASFAVVLCLVLLIHALCS